jgi:hypothetical protein
VAEPVATAEYAWANRLSALLKDACTVFPFKPGLKIELRTDGVPAGGANVSGALSCVLAGCLMLHSGFLEEDDITLLQKGIEASDLAAAFNSKRFLVAGRPPAIRRSKRPMDNLACLVYVAWCLECDPHRGMASGYGAFAPLMPYKLPFVFYPQPRGDQNVAGYGGVVPRYSNHFRYAPLRLCDWDEEEPPATETVLRQAAKNLGDMNIVGFPIVRGNQRNRPAPYSWGVIYTGIPKNTGKRISETLRMPAKRLKAAWSLAEVRGRFRVHPKGRAESSIDAFRMCCISKGRLPSLGIPRQLELLGVQIELFHALQNTLRSEGAPKAMEELASAMRRIQGELEGYGLGWYEGSRVASEFYRAVGRESRPMAAAKMTGGGGGGCLVWVAPAGMKSQVLRSLGLDEQEEEAAGKSPLADLRGIRSLCAYDGPGSANDDICGFKLDDWRTDAACAGGITDVEFCEDEPLARMRGALQAALTFGNIRLLAYAKYRCSHPDYTPNPEKRNKAKSIQVMEGVLQIMEALAGRAKEMQWFCQFSEKVPASVDVVCANWRRALDRGDTSHFRNAQHEMKQFLRRERQRSKLAAVLWDEWFRRPVAAAE